MDESLRPADPAAEELFAMLYSELHGLAEHHLRRGGSSLTLGTTTLLHEAYLNISGREELAFENRSRFLAYASRAMRGLVIDYARRRRARRRGPEFEITLVEEDAGSGRTETIPVSPSSWTCTSSAASRSWRSRRSAGYRHAAASSPGG